MTLAYIALVVLAVLFAAAGWTLLVGIAAALAALVAYRYEARAAADRIQGRRPRRVPAFARHMRPAARR